MTTKFNIPTILVVFGATGDLMRKKIIPSLFYLFNSGSLPKTFQIVAYSRRPLHDVDYQECVITAIETYYKTDYTREDLEKFTQLFTYQQGEFEPLEDFKKLGERLGNIDGMWRVCSNKLFYLSVPPSYYEQIFANLKASHLTDPCSEEEGWTRVLVEKPFGDDLSTARHLDDTLSQLFKEEQIYRIDHYLAKEMLQNTLTFRFSNNLFEPMWSARDIESIDIRLLETLGVEDRGVFYDGVGALRDVGQNHLLQMLALVTMERPTSFKSEAIRAMRAEAINQLEIMDEAAIKKRTFRAQYDDYQSIKGVAPDSQTETYFKVCTGLTSPRWQGVPITLEAGKRMGKALKEIVVTFKHPQPCLCPPGAHYQNRVVIQLEPEEGIKITFYSKKPGFDMAMEERTLDFSLHDDGPRAQYVEEYAKLLLDAIHGDQTLFVSTDEVKAMWRAIDPIVKGWHANLVPMDHYAPDSADITEKATASLDCSGHHSAAVSGTATSSRHIDPYSPIAKEIGIVGLGKMGANTARRLMEQGWRVVGYNRSSDDTQALEKEGLVGAYSLAELVEKLPTPRVVWLMLPAGPVIDEIIFGENGLVHYLKPDDIIIDAGNSFYKDAVIRAKKLEEFGIQFADVGFSGGPGGARNGACLMIGGRRNEVKPLEILFRDLAQPDGYQFFEGIGAGHFVKMIHNGIEYGMMQAIAEGFAIMKKSDYDLNLEDVARIYQNGSVIESRLVDWLQKAFEFRGQDLREVSGSVKHTGEGEWTVKTADDLGVAAKVIKDAFEFRVRSDQNPSYTGKILSALREQFGGHAAK